ncbi:ABC transporter [Actinoplanes italicus]|uniref:ATP-binding cassette subfamily C protein CydCD n=1 Tax=Actinoplanes italicus TaxID=113567 RepID=A0A2T0K2C2_9ACTN|nr:thiol reductant ABC exporter subunit CydC [Actinoplanes italicus]PRX16989.1 ATP-binding cassette subfamily C protein CydCD [Actinoplanes italicus]GIE36452.1 ABC transporter [Actinoplanes italicus]
MTTAPRRVAKGPIDPRLLRHARTSRTGVALLALIGFGQAAATILIALALCGIVTAFTPATATAWPTTRGQALLYLAAAFLARAGLAWAEQVIAHRTAARVTDELRRSLLTRVIERGPAWVAAYGPGRLTTVLGTGLDALRPWFSGYLPALVLGVLLPPLVVAIMAVADPASAVITLLTLPLIPLLGALIGWATKARAQRRWAADARLAGHFLDVVRGLPTLRMYGRAERQIHVMAGLTDRHRRATMRVLRVAFLSSTALDLVGTLSVGLIAVQAGLRVAAGSMDLGPALLVILLAPEAYRPLREMAARYHASTDAGAVIADVDDILTDQNATTEPASPALPRTTAEPAAPGLTGITTGPASHLLTARRADPAPLPLTRMTADPASLALTRIAAGRWGVRATGLRARYPGAFEDALWLPGLTVRAGELVGLKGPSGAGKTTALRVLAGLHPAEAGAIAVGRTFHLPQRPALPHARTVADAFPADATPDDRQDALATVGLTGEVTDQTPLGEHGAGISAGQRQRLALAVLLHRAARAIADRRPTAAGPVVTLLLDEPTAHLDTVAERLVIDRLHEFAGRGCAVLVVAHRPALLAAADRTVTLQPPAGPVRLRSTVSATVLDALEQPSWTAAHLPAVYPGAQRCDEDPQPAPTSSRTGSADGQGGHGPKGPWWGRLRRSWVAAGLGAGSSLAGILLTGAAAWLLVRASSLPPVLSLSAAVVLVRGSAVARPLLRYLERLVSHEVAFERLGRQRATVYADLIPHVPGPRLHRRGDLLTKLVDDVDAGTDGLLRGRLPAASAAVTAVICLGAVAWIAPVALVAVTAGLVISGVLAPAVAGWQADRQEAATSTARAALRDAMVETVDGAEELGAGGGRPDVPGERSRALALLEARAARAAGLATAIAHAGWGTAVAGVAVTLTGVTLSAEWSAVLLLAAVVLGETIVALPEAAIARRRAAAARSRVGMLTSDHAVDPPARRGRNGPGQKSPEEAGRGGPVRVEGLTAGWDAGRAPVLDGLELRLTAGSRTAITGRSGCGKSTLAAVLAGLLAPRAGIVEVGGNAVLVGDETAHVFASTVRENLRLASPAATDSQLEAVLARVGLGGMRLDAWLGTGGGTISGGQRRRLATARALLADPALLILDEPTEGIDEEGARDLMADLLDAASGRTVLVFAHREEGLDLVDRTFELGRDGLREKRDGLKEKRNGSGRARDGVREKAVPTGRMSGWTDRSSKVGSWHGRPHPAPGTPF